jgi:sulfopyruvate decarboxylase TPP-binding subunit
MIEAQDFVEAARSRGIEWYACVPCSFLTPFINYVINDERLTYISLANEGDAMATAAGAVIGGHRAAVMTQNSGLAAVLLTGSGTAAVEPMLSSLIPQTGELLVLENGVYGERLTCCITSVLLTFAVFGGVKHLRANKCG